MIEDTTSGIWYEYFINLDERDEFFADVRHVLTVATVFEIHGFEFFEDGFMRHKHDFKGLAEYLRSLSIIPADGLLAVGN